MSYEWCIEFIMPNHIVNDGEMDFSPIEDITEPLENSYHLSSYEYLNTWADICNYKKEIKKKQRLMEED